MQDFKILIPMLALLLMTLVFSGCATYNPRIYKEAFSQVEQKADSNAKNGDFPQAAILYRSLLDSQPENKDVRKNLDNVLSKAPELSVLFNKKKLGSNKGDRFNNKDFGVMGRILLYVPNRILDIIDIFTVEGGVSYGFGAGAKVTEYVSVGGQLTLGEAVLGLNRRHLSSRATIDNYVELFPVEARFLIESRAYTGGAYGLVYGNGGIKNPEDNIFQRSRDFWSVGARAQVFFMAANAEIHPLEFFDFFAGLLFFDPLRDDMGASKGIRLTKGEKEALSLLADQTRVRDKSRGK